LISNSGTISYGEQATVDPRSGVLSATLSGGNRYSLLEKFNNVANSSSGQTPGNMNFLVVGEPFVDPWSWPGAIGGAIVGAAVGGVVGAFVGNVPGAIAGALIGGVIGFVVGGLFASDIADWLGVPRNSPNRWLAEFGIGALLGIPAGIVGGLLGGYAGPGLWGLFRGGSPPGGGPGPFDGLPRLGDYGPRTPQPPIPTNRLPRVGRFQGGDDGLWPDPVPRNPGPPFWD
jgi:hypothetical protein